MSFESNKHSFGESRYFLGFTQWVDLPLEYRVSNFTFEAYSQRNQMVTTISMPRGRPRTDFHQLCSRRSHSILFRIKKLKYLNFVFFWNEIKSYENFRSHQKCFTLFISCFFHVFRAVCQQKLSTCHLLLVLKKSQIHSLPNNNSTQIRKMKANKMGSSLSKKNLTVCKQASAL